jgi:DNA polymerase-3 subunit epsilon
MGIDFVGIDFETANGQRGSACAVGLVRVRDGVVVDRLYGLIRPPVPVDYFAPANVRVHGITASMVARAPEWPKALRAIRQFVGEDLLVAHNAPFEASVIIQACGHTGDEIPGLRIMCSLATSRRLHPDRERHGLVHMARLLGVPEGEHHNALDDAEMSANVMSSLATSAGYSDLRLLARRLGVGTRDLRMSPPSRTR